MKKELEKKLNRSKALEKDYKNLLKRLKKQSKKDVDRRFHEEHETAFESLDCLECANCCKTTSPIFKDQDIKRLSKLFKMKPPAFIDEYLRMDDEEDYVLKSAPCPFLNADNTCFVYDVRPQACREYPHTDRKNMHQILNETGKNSLVCPAVSDVLFALKKEADKKLK